MDHGTPAECFDIVVLAEGFRDSELPQFDHLCQLLAVGLLNMPPFSEVQDLINVHTVKTVSRHSGIDDVPVKGVRKDTCFDVSGFFDGADYIGYVGTHRPELIYAAADLAAPLEHVEVMLVVVNSPLDGGSAFPGSRLAFVTHWDTTTRFVNIAAHECAHVIAGLADEYINCTLKQPCESQANQATEAQRLQGRSLRISRLSGPAVLGRKLSARSTSRRRSDDHRRGRKRVNR